MKFSRFLRRESLFFSIFTLLILILVADIKLKRHILKMKTKAMGLIVGTVYMFSLIGCSSTRVITPKAAFTLSENATLITTKGVKHNTRLVKTTADSIVASYNTSTPNLHFHFSEIEKVVVKDGRKGAWQGFLLGVPVGVVGGYLAGSDNAQDALASRGEGAIIYGFFGGVIGPIIGAIRGKTKTYLFKETQEKTTSSK